MLKGHKQAPAWKVQAGRRAGFAATTRTCRTTVLVEEEEAGGRQEGLYHGGRLIARPQRFVGRIEGGALTQHHLAAPL